MDRSGRDPITGGLAITFRPALRRKGDGIFTRDNDGLHVAVSNSRCILNLREEIDTAFSFLAVARNPLALAPQGPGEGPVISLNAHER